MENKDHDGRSSGWAVRGKNEERGWRERERERERRETDGPIRPYRQTDRDRERREGGGGGGEKRGVRGGGIYLSLILDDKDIRQKI